MTMTGRYTKLLSFHGSRRVVLCFCDAPHGRERKKHRVPVILAGSEMGKGPWK